MCEKPMTLTSDEAKELQKLVWKKAGLRPNAQLHGYPMAKLARDMVKKGDLGKIRKIVVQYPQGWLATALEKTGQLQASWRTGSQADRHRRLRRRHRHPRRESGRVYLRPQDHPHLSAELTTFVQGRPVDDDCNCLLKFDNGAKGPARQPDRHRRRKQPCDLGYIRRERQP